MTESFPTTTHQSTSCCPLPTHPPPFVHHYPLIWVGLPTHLFTSLIQSSSVHHGEYNLIYSWVPGTTIIDRVCFAKPNSLCRSRSSSSSSSLSPTQRGNLLLSPPPPPPLREWIEIKRINPVRKSGWFLAPRICDVTRRKVNILEEKRKIGKNGRSGNYQMSDRWMDGWMSGWMVGWMSGWMDGWMDGWIDGRADGEEEGDKPDSVILHFIWREVTWQPYHGKEKQFSNATSSSSPTPSPSSSSSSCLVMWPQGRVIKRLWSVISALSDNPSALLHWNLLSIFPVLSRSVFDQSSI